MVFDEFTSVVDRTVARVASAALSKAIRSGAIAVRFVAVTCHYDVVRWLGPDWVLDMSGPSLSRGRVRPVRQAHGRRPPLALEISRCDRSMWKRFERHHYLSGTLHRSAMCFLARFEDQPAAFTAVLPFPHPRRPGWREHRTVCLPDFQGVGIGSALSDFVASLYVATGKPYFSTTSHPAMIHHRAHSPLWKMRRAPAPVSRHASTSRDATCMADSNSRERITAGFEYVGAPRVADARRLGVTPYAVTSS
jgi:GNAT superfamily N-acetyltransferase